MEKLINEIKNRKSIAVLVTELIENFEDMCPCEIEEALREIRDRVEIDTWLMRVYRKEIREMEMKLSPNTK